VSWKDLIILCVGIIGIIAFLYGSNYYDAVVGWSGIFLFIGAIAAEIVLKAYDALGKKKGNV
jgi:arginine exporter protein ArgO